MREQIKKAITDHLVITNEPGINYSLDKIENVCEWEMVKFAEWIAKEKWHRIGDIWYKVMTGDLTTAELLKLFKERG